MLQTYGNYLNNFGIRGSNNALYLNYEEILYLFKYYPQMEIEYPNSNKVNKFIDLIQWFINIPGFNLNLFKAYCFLKSTNKKFTKSNDKYLINFLYENHLMTKKFKKEENLEVIPSMKIDSQFQLIDTQNGNSKVIIKDSNSISIKELSLIAQEKAKLLIIKDKKIIPLEISFLN